MTMSTAYLSFRLGVPLWMTEARLLEVLDALDQRPGIAEEVAFFTSATHAPLPLAEIERRAEVLAARLALARERGYRAGINHLATIGHHEENLAASLHGAYTPLTDIDGQVTRGSYCPNDPAFRDYVAHCYEALTAAQPDFLWVDDDIRLQGHMPVDCTCFCERCLRRFAEETGVTYTRAALKAAFDTGTIAEKRAVRVAWLQHNRRVVTDLMRHIEQTVHAIKQGMPLGLMTGDRFYEGYGFAEWADALAGPQQSSVWWRPGGGFYADDRMRDMFEKAHSIGRQVSALPPQVRVIQSEIENFPYQSLRKATRVNGLEAAAYIAAGCTGAAYNVLTMYDEPIDEYRPLLDELATVRPFLDRLVQAFERTASRGVYTGWSAESWAAHHLNEGAWCDGGEIWQQLSVNALEMLEIGLPAGYTPETAAVTILSGPLALGMTDEEITRALSGGVYMDGTALEALNSRGYGELTGFTVDRWVEDDCQEEFTADSLNGMWAGRQRDARQSFKWWSHPAALLHPASADARSLARAIDYTGTELSACCLGISENRLGGRVCVAGYFPWTFLQNAAKAAQIKQIFRWLSHDTLPGYVASLHKMTLWSRETVPGQLAVALVNGSLDPAREAVIALCTEAAALRVVDMACHETVVAAIGKDGGYTLFTLPEIAPWEMRLLLTE